MAKTQSKPRRNNRRILNGTNNTNSNLFKNTKKRIDSFLARRPHRSFRLTRRRDYNRSLELPGYFAFTNYVVKTIWAQRKLFGILALVSSTATVLVVGIAGQIDSQKTYSTLQATINATSDGLFEGALGEIGKAGLLFVASASGGISQNLSDIQQLYAGIITILTWLISVWLLRNILAGHKVKLRDGIYNAGAPIVSTFLVLLTFIGPALLMSFGLIMYGAAAASGLLAGGVEAMLFWLVELVLLLVSIYWIISTFLALVIVTLPGMYPIQALRIAGDMVVGRRLRIFYRLLWMSLNIVIVWALIMIPIILIDSLFKGLWPTLSWLPVVPFLFILLSTTTIVFVSAYIYLLYRKVVDDDSEPA